MLSLQIPADLWRTHSCVQRSQSCERASVLPRHAEMALQRQTHRHFRRAQVVIAAR